MTTTIAGHNFIRTTAGLTCEGCQRRLVDVTGATKADIGKAGWAHSGLLTHAEYEEIVAYRDALWLAVTGVSAP